MSGIGGLVKIAELRKRIIFTLLMLAVYRVGVHIADVGHYVKKNDVIDRQAGTRASSIYTPDQKISMIPPGLAEDLCSLKAGQTRPAISIMARIPSGSGD